MTKIEYGELTYSEKKKILKLAIKKSGLKKTKIAKDIGISACYLSVILSDSVKSGRNIPAHTGEKLANYLKLY